MLQLPEQQLEEPRVRVERHRVGVDVALQREADVERDESAGDLALVARRLPVLLREATADLLGADLARAAPERRGELARVRIAPGMREDLEEQPDHPPRRLLVDRRRTRADLARRQSGALARVAPGQREAALLQQRGEELLLGGEVRIEGAARVAGLGRDRLDAGPGEAALDEHTGCRVEQRGPRLVAALGTGQAGRRHFHTGVYLDTVMDMKRLVILTL